MNKALKIILLSLLPATLAVENAYSQESGHAAADSSVLQTADPHLTLEAIDTVDLHKHFTINNYTMIGVEYGPSMLDTHFTPVNNTKGMINPQYFGVTLTHYGKMFGYMPYFGWQFGVFYGHEGYQFKENKETGFTNTLEGATKAVFDIVEVPFLLEGHYDATHFKLIADIGPYAGYRLAVHRTGDFVTEGLENDFASYDRRWDYGLQGGLGFGLVFDPIEIHIKAKIRYSWGTLYDPDYYSTYYYRFAYPFDFMLTAGLHFHLGKRTGKTAGMLRREAYDMVYNPKPAEEQ